MGKGGRGGGRREGYMTPSFALNGTLNGMVAPMKQSTKKGTSKRAKTGKDLTNLLGDQSIDVVVDFSGDGWIW